MEFTSYMPQVGEVQILFKEVLRAILLHTERSINGFAKMSISYEVTAPANNNIVLTLGPCIIVSNDDAVLDPGFCNALYKMIDNATNSPSSSVGRVHAIIIRVYMIRMKDFVPLTEDELIIRLDQVLRYSTAELPSTPSIPLSSVTSNSYCSRKNKTSKPRTDIMKKVRSDSTKGLKRFMVADIETILNDNLQHVPYAVGVMKVDPADGVKGIDDIVSWFSEDYSIVIEHDFERRSTRVLNLFIDYIEANARSSKTPYNVIYFHNLSKFDGILLILCDIWFDIRNTSSSH
jgi:hypothetical protein